MYSEHKYKEEQFRKTWSSNEDDFLLTLKQYLRHMAPDADKPDLFMQPIINPAKEVWYNRSHKVSEARCANLLKSMAKIVGIDTECFSNKSGRVTLITRMAAQGVPDEVGMMITGHHSVDGYGRYDRTKDLKMEAANLVSRTPELTFKSAMEVVNKKFMQEQYVGSSDNLRPLMCGGSSNSLAVGVQQKQVLTVLSVACLAYFVVCVAYFDLCLYFVCTGGLEQRRRQWQLLGAFSGRYGLGTYYEEEPKFKEGI
jgi:hypothetical protein